MTGTESLSPVTLDGRGRPRFADGTLACSDAEYADHLKQELERIGYSREAAAAVYVLHPEQEKFTWTELLYLSLGLFVIWVIFA